MSVDRNGMSHKPKGLPRHVAGTYEGLAAATGDDDLIDMRAIGRSLLTDPDIHDVGSLTDLTGRMRPARDGEDDRPLVWAWIAFDPTTEDGGDEERASIILHGMHHPLRLHDPDGAIRRALCLRIRHTALEPDRQIRRLHLEEYDTIRPDSTDDPYADPYLTPTPDELELERRARAEREQRLEEAKRKAAGTRDRHRREQDPEGTAAYESLQTEDPGYWDALGQGAGLTSDAPWASRLAMARMAVAVRKRHGMLAFDPRAAVAYRRTPGFKRLERRLLDGRPKTRVYKRLLGTVGSQTDYENLMRAIRNNPDVWEDDTKRPKPVYGFGEHGQAVALRWVIEHRGVKRAVDVIRGEGVHDPEHSRPYGMWRAEDLLHEDGTDG